VRGSDRFRVLAVIDPPSAGRDAGEVLDGRVRDIPIYASLQEALSGLPVKPDWCIVGIATHGGQLTAGLRTQIAEAIDLGLGIVNGLHGFVGDDPDLAAQAAAQGVAIVDVRRPRPRSELHFWTGEVLKLAVPRLSVLGTDCALGKRTTTRLLLAECNRALIRTEMIYTGQTGWMQGAACGFILDSTVNDFVSGEVERAILTCVAKFDPELILIEGQSSLRNPSGPCGAELLLSAGAKGVILQHAPGRLHFDDYEDLDLRIPPIAEEIALIRLLGARVLAVTLNGTGLSAEALIDHQNRLTAELGLPVVRPLEEGVAPLLPVVREFLERKR